MAGIDVSVIVPCYNTEAYLDEALSSAEQNDRVSIEIIVLNDGSTDGSLDIMSAHAIADSRVRVIDKENQGYGATMNRGISEARGTYVAILEPDDWVAPHMYDVLLEYGMGFGPDMVPDIIKSPTCAWCCPRRPISMSATARTTSASTLASALQAQDAPHLIQHHPRSGRPSTARASSREGIRFKEVPGAGWVDNPS